MTTDRLCLYISAILRAQLDELMKLTGENQTRVINRAVQYYLEVLKRRGKK